MFAYIDESGNTGKDNSNSQKNFFYMATASRYNLDLDLDGIMNKLKKELNIEEIHASEAPELIESISPYILNILKLNSVDFCISIIEKSFLAYSKMYDTLFDNIENIGARAQFYQFRPLRLMLLSNLIKIIPEDIAQNFYINCLLSNNEKQSIEVLIDTCNKVLPLLSRLQDKRAKEVSQDAFNWAKENAENLSLFSITKKDRWTHLPHVVCFYPVLSMLSIYAKKHKTRIQKIFHDEQNQFKRIFKEMHTLASDPRKISKWNLHENGSFDFKNIKESAFEMINSKQSYGIQISDICVYIYSHGQYVLENKELNPNTYQLLEYINEHTEPFSFTTEGCFMEANYYYNKIMETPFTESELNQGRLLIAKWENEYKGKQVSIKGKKQ